jgi:hypothetical protein
MGPYNLTTITALLLGACQAGISICLAYTTSRSPVEGVFAAVAEALGALFVYSFFFAGSLFYRFRIDRLRGGLSFIVGALGLAMLAIPEFSAVTASEQPYAGFLVASMLVKWLLIVWVYVAAVRTSINRA